MSCPSSKQDKGVRVERSILHNHIHCILHVFTRAGLDIPLLDSVINFAFPSRAKTFIHRVGRVARAGRSAVAYSLIYPDVFPNSKNKYVCGSGNPIFPNHLHCILCVFTRAGLDIPLLDNVINFAFPSKPKTFIHRVGRVARAGRSGVAYSLICPDEFPYLLDVHLMIGRRLVDADKAPKTAAEKHMKANSAESGDVYYGAIPRMLLDDDVNFVTRLVSRNDEIVRIVRLEVVNFDGKNFFLDGQYALVSTTRRHIKICNALHVWSDGERVSTICFGI